MRRTFLEFLSLKENAEKKAQSEIKLGDDADFKPFVVDDSKPGLRAIVKAFLDSAQVELPGARGIGSTLTTVDPSKGETAHKLKKKSIYLVGGAVRDHLKGKTPKDYDLATDATPEEIRLILSHAGFKETKPQGGKNAPKHYEKLEEPGSKNKIFYAKGWDRAGKEFVIGTKIHGTEYEIATFRKDSKGGDGRTPDKMEFGGLDDDAGRRDFTMNAMYIPLTNADGPNAKLIDPHGGAHDLRRGEVKFIGSAKDRLSEDVRPYNHAKQRLDEDQLRALRYIRFIASHGPNTKIPEDVKSAIEDIKELPAVSRERIRDEFLKALKNPEVDPTRYVKNLKDLNLLSTVFPDLSIKLDGPTDYSDKKEPRLAIAWLLRNNDPEKVKEVLQKGTWTNEEVKQIAHLVDLAKYFSMHKDSPELFFHMFHDKRDAHNRSGLGQLKTLSQEWGKMNKIPEELMHHFIGTNTTDTPGMIGAEGNRKINPEIRDFFGGETPRGEQFGIAQKAINNKKFYDKLKDFKYGEK